MQVKHLIEFLNSKGIRNDFCYNKIGVSRMTWSKYKRGYNATETNYYRVLELAKEYGY